MEESQSKTFLQTSRQVDKQTSRQADNQTSRQVDKKTSRQVDKQTKRQVDKQTSRQEFSNLAMNNENINEYLNNMILQTYILRSNSLKAATQYTT